MTACSSCEFVFGAGHVAAPCKHQSALLIPGGTPKILHFDEVPILFTGLNALGEHVIISSVDEDGSRERFLHATVSDPLYQSFRRGEVSWQSILRGAPFYLVTCFNSGATEIVVMTAAELPQELMPLDDSFCPVMP